MLHKRDIGNNIATKCYYFPRLGELFKNRTPSHVNSMFWLVGFWNTRVHIRICWRQLARCICHSRHYWHLQIYVAIGLGNNCMFSYWRCNWSARRSPRKKILQNGLCVHTYLLPRDVFNCVCTEKLARQTIHRCRWRRCQSTCHKISTHRSVQIYIWWLLRHARHWCNPSTRHVICWF